MRLVRSRIIAAVGVAAALLAHVRIAVADPLDDLKTAALATYNTHSYHVKMTGTALGGTSEGDIQYPSTMHMKTASGMEMIVTPSASFMKMNGKWTKYPSGSAAIFDNPAEKLAKIDRSKYRIVDLGMRPFDGSSMHAYAVDSTMTGRHLKSIEYVDGSGRLAGFQAQQMTMRFTNFGEPVHIVAPM